MSRRLRVRPRRLRVRPLWHAPEGASSGAGSSNVSGIGGAYGEPPPRSLPLPLSPPRPWPGTGGCPAGSSAPGRPSKPSGHLPPGGASGARGTGAGHGARPTASSAAARASKAPRCREVSCMAPRAQAAGRMRRELAESASGVCGLRSGWEAAVREWPRVRAHACRVAAQRIFHVWLFKLQRVYSSAARASAARMPNPPRPAALLQEHAAINASTLSRSAAARQLRVNRRGRRGAAPGAREVVVPEGGPLVERGGR